MGHSVKGGRVHHVDQRIIVKHTDLPVDLAENGGGGLDMGKYQLATSSSPVGTASMSTTTGVGAGGRPRNRAQYASLAFQSVMGILPTVSRKKRLEQFEVLALADEAVLSNLQRRQGAALRGKPRPPPRSMRKHDIVLREP